MRSSPTTTPAEMLLREDLAAGDYAAGEDRGYWRLVSLEWPYAVFEIAAAPRPGAPGSYGFRLNLEGYPQMPTAQPWDIEVDAPLPPPRWPGGGDRIGRAFNPGWRSDALYVPMDRLAIAGHHDWPVKYAAHLWDPARDVSQYLRLIYDLLHDETYGGSRGH
jgi:hypothetical protein